MLKQPDQHLRYVPDDEKFSGLGAAWADLITRSMDFAPASGPQLVLPFLGQAHISSVYSESQLALAVPLSGGVLFDQTFYSPITDCGICHADRLNGPAAVSLLLSKRHRPILLKAIPVHSQFYGMFENTAAHFSVLAGWERASLQVRGSFDNWFSSTFDTKRRKELKRQRTRLSERGVLQSLTLAKGADAAPFIDEFLELEAKGWKGDRGTALANDPTHATATSQALAALHALGKLRFWSLQLDDKTIASLFAYVDGNKASLGKIAYDEAYSKYSPGVLVIIGATEQIFAERAIEEVDSSAIPDHPMIDRIWRNRIAMADVMVAPATISSLRFSLVVLAEKMRRTLRAALKHTYYFLGRKAAPELKARAR